MVPQHKVYTYSVSW